MRFNQINPLVLRVVAAVGLAAGMSGACFASDALRHAPSDSLAVVVMRDLAAADSKAQTLALQLQLAVPGPWTALRMVAGINEGVNQHGECLVALLPPQPSAGPPNAASDDPDRVSLCALLPVSDYPALVRSLGGDPERRISRITVAAQDLIIARRGQWAVVMDEVARPRLELLLEQQPRAAAELDWIRCVESSDIALVVFRPAVQEMKERLASQLGPDLAEPESDVPDRGTSPPAAGQGPDPLFSAGLYKLLIDLTVGHLRPVLSGRSETHDLIASLDSLAVGLQLDEQSRVRIQIDTRLAAGSPLSQQLQPLNDSQRSADQTRLAVRKLSGGPFLAVGGGELPEPTRYEIARGALQETLQGLRTSADDPFDAAAVAELLEATRRASSQVTAVQFLARPAAAEDGIFSNSFLLLSTSNAAGLRDDLLEVERRWDRVMDSSRLNSRLKLQRRDVDFAGRSWAEFSADMAVSLGVQELSGAKEVMEKMFGEGGRIRLQLVMLDEQTLILATASQAQATAVLAELETAETASAAASSERAQANTQILDLLPTDSRLVVLVDPHEITDFERRLSQIEVGTVIGRPAIRVFPEGPPVAISVSITDDGGGLAVQAVALPETLKGLGDYLRSSR